MMSFDMDSFLKEFNSEKKCIDYFFKLKWSKGFRCPKCRNREFYLLKSHLFQCKKCKHQTSITAGTIIEHTGIPLIWWFRVIYLYINGRMYNSEQAFEKYFSSNKKQFYTLFQAMPKKTSLNKMLNLIRKVIHIVDQERAKESQKEYYSIFSELRFNTEGSQDVLPITFRFYLDKNGYEKMVIPFLDYTRFNLAKDSNLTTYVVLFHEFQLAYKLYHKRVKLKNLDLLLNEFCYYQNKSNRWEEEFKNILKVIASKRQNMLEYSFQRTLISKTVGTDSYINFRNYAFPKKTQVLSPELQIIDNCDDDMAMTIYRLFEYDPNKYLEINVLGDKDKFSIVDYFKEFGFGYGKDIKFFIYNKSTNKILKDFSAAQCEEIKRILTDYENNILVTRRKREL